MQSPLLRLSIACGLLTLTVAACGESGSDGPSSPSPSGTMTINILSRNGSRSFSPNPADAGGKAVVFRDTDSITHRVVLNDGTIDLGDVAPGALSRQITMPGDGTNYHCSLHPDMVGAVSARSCGAPPACVGLYCESQQ
jgi:plastocyanin